MKNDRNAGVSILDLPYFVTNLKGEVHSRAHALLRAWAEGGTGKPPSARARDALEDYLAVLAICRGERSKIRLLSEAVLSAIATGIEMHADTEAKEVISKLGRRGGERKNKANHEKKQAVLAQWAIRKGKLSKNAAAKRWASEFGVRESTIRTWLIGAE